MKTSKIFSAALMVLATFAMTSCEDWLTLYPQNKITDEQFWEDMNDLESVRYAAYSNFASSDVVQKILTWGELRSDNVLLSSYSNANNYQSLLRITEGRLDTANSINDWAKFYQTINYCNQVLYNGQKVQEKDPQFSSAQWRRIKAEMIAMRALNYFYLVRAFGNVPYVNTVIKNDAQVQTHRQMLQDNILDALINDVDAVKDDIRLYYAPTDRFSALINSTSLITKPFAYALLADLCMWRGAKYEGKSMTHQADSLYWRAYNYAKDAREIMDGAGGKYLSMYNLDNDDRNRSYMGPYYLTQNFSERSTTDVPNMSAHENLYENGNSEESIFEMSFNSVDQTTNGYVNSCFGYVSSSSLKSFYSNFEGLQYCAPYSKTKNKTFDLRLLYTCAYTNDTEYQGVGASTSVNISTNGYMMKYQTCESFLKSNWFEKVSDDQLKFTLKFTEKDYNNFIIYRKSDVLFIEAEAIALLQILGDEHAASVDLEDARNIVAEHRRRSFYKKTDWNGDPSNDVYMKEENTGETAANWSSASTVLKIVLDEKQLEFVGEGKRWFDIVRYMERKGATANAIYQMFSEGCKAYSMYKHNDRAKQCRSALRARWAFYNPVYYPEHEASNWVLYQNPYWDDDPTNNDPESGEPDGAFVFDNQETETSGEDNPTEDTPNDDNPEEGSGDDETTTGGDNNDENPDPEVAGE